MNTSGLLQSYCEAGITLQGKCSWFHEQTKKQIYFLNIPPKLFILNMTIPILMQ